MRGLYLRFPGGRKKALTISYDDGVEQDIQLLELMTKYEIRGTFNLNSGLFAPEGTQYPKGQIHRRMSQARCQEVFSCPLAEVATHGYTHPFLTALPAPALLEQILEDRKGLEAVFQRPIRGMAYPYGAVSDDVTEALALAGIVYSRTVESHHQFYLPKNWLRWGATCHHNDPELMALGAKFMEADPDRDPMCFYLWGHSYEFEQNDNWPVIEDFFRLVSGDQGVWYATNMEIYDYVTAYERLIYSTDLRMIQNPSAIPVWIQLDDILAEIPAGGCVSLF